MIIRLSTVKFIGTGAMDCRLCGHRTVFPNNAAAIVYRTGDRQAVQSVTDLSLLHECGRIDYWVCEVCDFEADETLIALAMEQLARAPSKALRDALLRAVRCPRCGGEIEQRRSRPQAPVD